MYILSEEQATSILNAETVEDQKRIFFNSFRLVKGTYPDIRCKYYYTPDGKLESVSIFTFYGGKPQGLKEVSIDDLPFIEVYEEYGRCVVRRMRLYDMWDSPFR